MQESDKIISTHIINMSKRLVSFVIDETPIQGNEKSELLIKALTSLRLAYIFLIESTCDKSSREEMNKDIDECTNFIIGNFEELSKYE